jgi:mannose-6-phosphate isomerase-like protein (cupin superfamily)
MERVTGPLGRIRASRAGLVAGRHVARAKTEVAPDGSRIRRLLVLRSASFVHCTLGAGETSQAMRHRSVEEIWFVLKGCGQLWRRRGSRQDVAALVPGFCTAIAAGTRFQFRNTGRKPLELVL